MRFDYSRLRGRIREFDLTIDECADEAGIARSTFSLKINGHFGFKQEEIIRLCRVLAIPLEHIHRYFFQVIEEGGAAE